MNDWQQAATWVPLYINAAVLSSASNTRPFPCMRGPEIVLRRHGFVFFPSCLSCSHPNPLWRVRVFFCTFPSLLRPRRSRANRRRSYIKRFPGSVCRHLLGCRGPCNNHVSAWFAPVIWQKVLTESTQRDVSQQLKLLNNDSDSSIGQMYSFGQNSRRDRILARA